MARHRSASLTRIAIFTPNGYRDAMAVAGSVTIVRAPVGIHLNERGARLLASKTAGTDSPGLRLLEQTPRLTAPELAN